VAIIVDWDETVANWSFTDATSADESSVRLLVAGAWLGKEALA
jgi:hypothetical protein